MADARPVRLQLSRKKGFNLQAHSLATNGLPAVNCARPTMFGNPYDWREWKDAALAEKNALWFADEREEWCKQRAVEAFEEDIRDGEIKLDMQFLRGKNLACWCSARAVKWSCHCDVLLDLATRPLVCEGVAP